MSVTLEIAKDKAQEWLGEDLKIIAAFEYDAYYGFESVPKNWDGKGGVSGVETFVNKETGGVKHFPTGEYCKLKKTGKRIRRYK